MYPLIKTLFALLLLSIMISCGPLSRLKTNHEDDDTPWGTKVILSNSFQLDTNRKITVMPFINNGKGGYDFASSDKLAMYLMENGFTVIERTQVEAIFNELSLSLTGALKKEDLNRIGHMLNIDAIVFGTINWKYLPGRTAITIYGGASKEGRFETESMTAKVVNVTSGEVVISAFTENSSEYEKSIADGIKSAIAMRARTRELKAVNADLKP